MARNPVLHRLSQFAAAWFGSFLATLVVSFVAVSLAGMDLPGVADMLLPAVFAGLAVGTIAAVGLTFASRASVGAKLLVLVLAVVLVLPLLWAPVLAVVLTAWFTGSVIEYSSVYAAFRITVSQLLYPLVSAIFSGAALRFVWEVFQVFGTIVGTIASAISVWRFFSKLLAPRETAEA